MCRFFSSNLDEFFMVRVAGLTEQAAAGVVVRSSDGLTPRAALAEIRERVLELTARQSKLWKKELCPALGSRGDPDRRRSDELDDDERRTLGDGFQREIFPVLTPLAVSPGQRFPYISGLTLSLGVLARDPETGEERFARVKVPEGLPRFFSAGAGGKLLMLENVIAHFLDRLFPGMEIVERSVFRVTRDADFEVSDDADDLLEAVEQELQRRRFGDAVRLEISSSTSRRCWSGCSRDSASRTTRSTRSTGRSTSPTSISCSTSTGPSSRIRSRPDRRRRGSCTRRSRATSSPRSVAATSSSTSRTSRSPAASRRSSARRPATRT